MKPQPITDYKLVLEYTAAGFAEKVKQFIGDGWQPYGPPLMDSGNSEGDFCIVQAMVKYQI